MTREEILNMPAGKEMDALIAEKFFEITNPDPTKCPYCGFEMWVGGAGNRSRCSICGEWRYSAYKEYSTDITEAWEVVNKTSLFNVCVLYGSDSDQRWVIIITKPEFGEAEIIAETAPLAICRAALLATI